MKNTSTRSDMVGAICKEVGLSESDATVLLEEFLAEVEGELGRGNKVTLSSFGTFSVRAKKARQGRNPKTGEPAVISARRTVSFTPSASLKERVRASVPAKKSA
ncbi:integration host factor subunit alpha [Alphaproteobacteria bacterium]|nr:integration host factor subunit alpha [Alphaproteobacteria bacterium]